MTLTEETRALLAEFLRHPTGLEQLPPALRTELLFKGALAALQQDATPEAVQILEEVSRAEPMDGAQALALEALVGLASGSHAEAIAALFRLAVDHGIEAAQLAVLENNFTAPTARLQAAFLLLTAQSEAARSFDPDLKLLTSFVLEQAAPELAQRVLQAASRAGWQNWISLINAVQQPGPENSAALLDRYPTLPPVERILTIAVLDRLAAANEPLAQETLTQLVLRYDDAQAYAISVKRGYLPREAVHKALFLFLTQQWQAYETFDFDQRLLVAAYETAGLELRKRMLDISRQSGQMEWFRSLSGANRTRWLRDLSDADWETAIRGLESAGRFEEMWRLSQLSSPLWSARILARLEAAGWQPAPPHELEAFTLLANLAREAAAAPPAIRPRYSFQVVTMDDLRSLALSPDGRTLALGSASNAIHLWRLEEKPEALPILYAASTQTHALAFSPDGELLAAAVADQTIRVYQWLDGRAVKTMPGHKGLIRSIAISSDNRTMYSASFDGTLRAWRFPVGTESRVIDHSQGEIFAVALSPDSRELIAAGADLALKVFQIPEGAKVREMEGHSATVTMLAASPTTPFVASYSRDQSIRVWNYINGRQVQAFDAGTQPVTGLCIHPNEQILFSASTKGQLTVWNISTGLSLQDLAMHRRAVIGLALTPSGDTLISASIDGAVTLWNLETFLLARQPVEDMPLDRASSLQKQLKTHTLTGTEKAWLAFLVELLRWKQRFDIQIEGSRTISVGEFDIQL